MKNISVKINGHYVKGNVIENCCVFSGIPFAKTERFSSPELITSLEKDIDATGEGIDCPQYKYFHEENKNSFYYREFNSKKNHIRTFTEDFLTLNIMTPLSAVNNSGESQASSSEDPATGDTESFTEKEIGTEKKSETDEQKNKLPVIVFIHGGSFELGSPSDCPFGNTTEYADRNVILVTISYRLSIFGMYNGESYILQDQLTGLDWVIKNISSFGGDPHSITLMGQSAGAFCITDLLFSGKLEGKIKAAVLMSGAGVILPFLAPFRKKESLKFWKQVRQTSGVTDEDEFKKLPAEDLFNAWKNTRRSMRSMQPPVDGKILPDLTFNLAKKGKLLNVPLMIGITGQDMLPLFMKYLAVTMFRAARKNKGQKIYYYFFDRDLPGNVYKSFHSSDLWYMFGNFKESWRPFEEKDIQLKDKMMNCVSSFAASGNPGDADWTPAEKGRIRFRLFDGNSDRMVSGSFIRKRMWKTAFREHGPL